MYGTGSWLIARDGGLIGCDPSNRGPLLGEAQAMAQILCELAAGVPAEHLRRRAAQSLERIDSGRSREPGEDARLARSSARHRAALTVPATSEHTSSRKYSFFQ